MFTKSSGQIQLASEKHYSKRGTTLIRAAFYTQHAYPACLGFNLRPRSVPCPGRKTSVQEPLLLAAAFNTRRTPSMGESGGWIPESRCALFYFFLLSFFKEALGSGQGTHFDARVRYERQPAKRITVRRRESRSVCVRWGTPVKSCCYFCWRRCSNRSVSDEDVHLPGRASGYDYVAVSGGGHSGKEVDVCVTVTSAS